MNIGVLLFFLHNILATALMGCKFVVRKDPVFKNFGIALLLDSAAFVIWSAAVVLKPSNLELFVTVGAAFFIASLVFLVITASQKSSPGVRQALIIFGALLALVLFVARTFLYPSAPGFSPEGLFFFNLHPFVTMVYIFGLLLAAVPAIEAVASKFNHTYSWLVRYGFLAEVAGGIVLITTTDTQVLYIIGWIMGAAYLALWSILLFSKNSWKNTAE